MKKQSNLWWTLVVILAIIPFFLNGQTIRQRSHNTINDARTVEGATWAPNANYFAFRFLCKYENSRLTVVSPWMDERMSNIITLGEKTKLSCDKVYLQLRPIGMKFTVGTIKQWQSGVKLYRETSKAADDDMTMPIPWETASNYGAPDYVSIEDNIATLAWNGKWQNNYWAIKYDGYSDNKEEKRYRRVRIAFTDHYGNEHELFIVPWWDFEVPIE